MRTKTNRTLRKILSIVLCLALVMSYVPFASVMAGAAESNIPVIEGNGLDSDDSEFGTTFGDSITSGSTAGDTSWSDEAGKGNLIFQWGYGDTLDVTLVDPDGVVTYETSNIQAHSDDSKSSDLHWAEFPLSSTYADGTYITAAYGFDNYTNNEFWANGNGSVANIFTQTASGDPSFLSDGMLMYGESIIEDGTTSMFFDHIPATFRFVITNTHEQELSLESVKLQVVEADGNSVPVASQYCDVFVEGMNGYAEFTYSNETYDSVTTNLNDYALEPGKSYIAYALALPLEDDEAFIDKTVQVVVNTSEGECVAFELSTDDISNANPNNDYNWVGGKSYTMHMETRCYDGCAFDTTGKCTVCGYECTHKFDDNGFCLTCGAYQPATQNADGYYEISNVGNLFWLAEQVNYGSLTKFNAVLTSDLIIPDSKQWMPINLPDGIQNASVFDGNGHSITLNQSNGLFSSFNYSVFHNVILYGTVTANTTGNIGAVVGSAYRTTIQNVISYVDVTNSNGNAGGLAGYFGGKHSDEMYSKIENCAVYADISGTNAGGFIGEAWNGTQYFDIVNCTYVGDITGTNAGAIVGYQNTDSNTCVFTNIYWCEADGIGFYGKRDTSNQVYTNTMAKTPEQFASGEVAYLLGEAWGQMSNTEGSLPVLTDKELYKVVTVGETGNYSVANVGDTNGDGTVDVEDYQAIVNKALADDHEQIETASYDDIIRYDFDGDGYLDVIDAYLLHLFINGFTTVDVYPVGDYDLNGKAFEEADIKAIKHAIENPEKLATYKKYASDINGDGKLSEEDLTELNAIYGELTGTECADNVKVYYRWGNKYSTCTATAMCTLCGEKVATETVNTTSETLLESTCTQDGKIKYTAIFANELFGTKVTEIVIKTKGHNWGEWKTEIPASALSGGKEKRICSVCTKEEERVIDKLNLDSRIVAYYTVVDDKVINLVDGKEMENAVVDDEGYFKGGKVKLPSTYEKASIEAVMIYNRLSTDLPVGNDLSYYGGTFLFTEAVDPSNQGFIKTPFGGGQIATNFTLRPSLNYNKRVMSDGESYWSLAFDKNESTYALQINDDYVEKTHWSNYINSMFTLSNEHQFKEFIVYSEKLTQQEMAEHFVNSGLSESEDADEIVGRVNNGITGLGSAFSFTKTGQYGLPEWYDTSTKAGNYSVNDGNGMVLNYTISDYVEPDLGIDHSKYESVHIIKKPEVLPLGYKYALSAVPYPFNVNHNGISDQYDVSWESSDETIALVIDGMVVPQKTGTVTITATLRGTEMSDSCTIKIVDENAKNDIAVKISADYISENGNSFSESDYAMTTNAIYDAISEAYLDGYNHIIFPEIDFYAVPTETEFYIPSGMTVEFPEGSAFHMMPSEKAKTEGYVYFRMGWGWWSCAIPTETASVEKDDNGNILAYYCRNSHLIIDKYYGEFYEEDATMSELYSAANQYQWDCNLLSIGKRAEFCSVEVREANCPTGFFITMGGKGNSELVNGGQGSIAANEFVSGWLNDNGELVENSNWISTNDFYLVSKAANGMDTLHEYYIGDWEHNLVTATQRLYDILWYDEGYNLLGINRWQYIDEGYSNKPKNAVYFKLSIQQSELPTGTNEYVRICPDESSRFCEIKNTNVINGATGLASVVGATEACWIHDNYVSGDGMMYGANRSLDLEDGWAGMRGTIIERNIFKKYAYSGSSDYRGPDTGILSLASGYNTFIISNYLGAIHQSNYNVANTHIINNVVDTMLSTFTNGSANDIRPKIYAHTYYNILGGKSNEISSNGVNYYYGNTIVPTVKFW